MLKTTVTLGVKDFLGFLCPQGDLIAGFIDQDRTLEGIRYHKEWQKHCTGECEVPVKLDLTTERLSLTLVGRIDHLRESGNTTLIQEFKTTETTPEQFGLMPVDFDLNQLKCYAAMYVIQNGLTEIKTELLYRHIPSKKLTTFSYTFSREELDQFFSPLWTKFQLWYHHWLDWLQRRNDSLGYLPFPFDPLRAGQSELIEQVRMNLFQGSVLWVEAPTGIGKTIGVLYPAIQLLVEKPFAKVFYLTAKTTQQENALKAIDQLKEKGAQLRSIHLVAKEKCCPKPQKICHPDFCEYAKGHFDRLNSALEELSQLQSFSSVQVMILAEKYRLCPFEFSLDASLWADILVGDYNYAFDPRVALRRYWDNPEFQGFLLVDEAHNLLERAREMYSVEFTKKELYSLYKTHKSVDPKLAKAFRALHKVFTQAENEEEVTEKSYQVQVEEHEPLLEALENLTQTFQQTIRRKKMVNLSKQSMDFLWNAWFALKVFSWYQEESFCTYFEKKGNDLKIKLFCIHPAQLVKKVLNKSVGSVFFSATLTPIEFFRDSLGGNQYDTCLKIGSPFPKNQQLVLYDPSLSTRWKDRDKTYKTIQMMIQRAVSAKKGNYMVYFPSYHYLKQVVSSWENHADFDLLVQTEGMKESEKGEFLSNFQPDREKTLIAFAVLGGHFSEGIDLVGERLSGVVIVGIGLPQVCLEREIIREYYQQVLEKGYAYAYLYPGLNRVSQAGGRVIRSETDAGFILLIDDRYLHSSTQALLPDHWKPLAKVTQYQALPMILNNFWKTLNLEG